MALKTTAMNSGFNHETIWSRLGSLLLNWNRLKKSCLPKMSSAVMDNLKHRGKPNI